jgi:hypothetical protein
LFAVNAERMRGDQRKSFKSGDLDSEGHMSRMRGEPNTLFVQDEIKHDTKANVFYYSPHLE